MEHGYLVINSKNRDTSYYSHNFRMTISPSIIIGRHNHNDTNKMNKITLKKVLIYNTYYNVTTENNKIDFNDNSDKTSTLTAGFYNSAELCSHIGTVMTATSAGYNTYTAAISDITGKMTISTTNNFSLLFSSGTNTATSTWKLLGYGNAYHQSAADSSAAATSQTGASPVNLSPITAFYFKLKINNKEIHNITIADSYQSATFIVPNVAANNCLNLYNGSDFEQSFYIYDDHINTIDVSVVNANNTAIDLNNCDWSMLLGIE